MAHASYRCLSAVLGHGDAQGSSRSIADAAELAAEGVTERPVREIDDAK